MGDPATDIGDLPQVYGESFVRRLRVSHPEVRQWMPRARFYAQALELPWVLPGLTSGAEFWFAAHLGGARDLGV